MNPNYIIIHHSLTIDSGSLSWDAIRRYHKAKNFTNIGYHYGIEYIHNSYEVLLGRFCTIQGAHCKHSDMNENSIGLCFVGDFDKISVPEHQWNRGLAFVNNLISFYNIPVENVLGHNEVTKDKRTCPGRKFDMIGFRKELYELTI